MKRKPTHKANAAFTLIELLLVMAVSGVIFTALATFTHTALHTTDVVQSQNLANQTARTALARMVREAALAKIFSATEEYRLAFTCTDITGDGNDDTVEYSWDPSTDLLTRTLNSTAETFAEGVSVFGFEYLFESEDVVTIAAPGDTLGMTLAQHAYTEEDEDGREDLGIEIGYGGYAMQYFTNQVEVPEASTFTLRVKTKTLPCPSDMYIYVTDDGDVVAYGRLSRWNLTTTYQDVTVDLTWSDGATTKMEPDKEYLVYLYARSWYSYCGTALVQHATAWPDLPNGVKFNTSSVTYGAEASLYFTLSGNLSITTPQRSTTSTSVLKKIKMSMTVDEKGTTTELSRSCKVANN
jgi:prepilin-type N-terminal cleavage/methylation domain-containing protein